MVTITRNSDIRKKCSAFMSYASGAVIAEQHGDFQKAAESWSKALAFSRHRLNREWAEIRIAFCANAAARKWSGIYESQGI
ncbi:ANR family transcriptional regulator [Cedecea neteri]|uniref:ANR family transcriptional regulator n=1 Tax=Cedecea neteri TaxID=158822 RepID=UPI002AA8ACB3|nr:ANR family transcriptional regulator [Cedecea neteri]WPU22593.1 ANR family transcriptional regulator [Cedecea neteri]